MMTKKYYKLHNFLTFSVEGEGQLPDSFDKEFAFYRTEPQVGAVNLQVVIGNFLWEPPRDSLVVNKTFILHDDTIYACDAYKVASWKIKITGLDSECTTVQVHGNYASKFVLARWFCESIIRLKMTLSGYPMLHSSSLCNGERGIVLAASPSTGKTTTLLTWLEKGNPFLSDEYSILDNNRIWSYVTPFRFHTHNLKINPVFSRNISFLDRLQIQWRTLLLKMTRGYADVTWNINLHKVKPDVFVVQHCQLAGVFVVTRTKKDQVARLTSGLDAVIKQLQIINQFEWRGFEHYIRAWSYAHPDGRVASLDRIEKEGLTRILKDNVFGQIHLPEKFCPKNFEEVIQVFDDLFAK
ncbi:MAG: hypothetical protein HQM16_08725 [Deltaproteobacteria bacterium]|nr:hypothetical protein [Deltaproteobacteria bacterium]